MKDEIEQFKTNMATPAENVPDNDVNTQEAGESPKVVLSNYEDEFDRKLGKDINLSDLKENKGLSLLLGITGSGLMGLATSLALTREARGVNESLDFIGVSSEAGYVALLGVAVFGAVSAAAANVAYKRANDGLKEMKNEQES